MKLVGKKVLVLKGFGSHFHTDALCPMVQDPMQDMDYTIEVIDTVEAHKVRIRGKWYNPCLCAEERLKNSIIDWLVNIICYFLPCFLVLLFLI